MNYITICIFEIIRTIFYLSCHFQEPHMINLNEDPLLSGVVFHSLKTGDYNIGRKDCDPLPQVCLSGLRLPYTSPFHREFFIFIFHSSPRVSSSAIICAHTMTINTASINNTPSLPYRRKEKRRLSLLPVGRRLNLTVLR